MIYHIIIRHDAEARVYIATSPDVRGLIMEADTAADLERRVRSVIPELLELNHQQPASAIVFRR